MDALIFVPIAILAAALIIAIRYRNKNAGNRINIKTCLNCGLVNHRSADQCDCGWTFENISGETANGEHLDLNVSVDGSQNESGDCETLTPETVAGKLSHQKMYFYSHQHRHAVTHCAICLDKYLVFSNAIDSNNHQYCCCLRCLHKYGGQDQIELATKNSRYATLAWKSIAALDQLLKEFPDPQRRPHGEKVLRAFIESTWTAEYDAYRMAKKITKRAWTECDLARIEDREEPSLFK
jgi:hypothetical protein